MFRHDNFLGYEKSKILVGINFKFKPKAQCAMQLQQHGVIRIPTIVSHLGVICSGTYLCVCL